MNLTFVHNNGDKCFKRCTFAFSLPSKSNLEELFKTHSTAILIPIGVSNCNPKDQFVKSVGRDLATKRLFLVKCELTKVEIRGTKHIFHFRSEVPNYFNSDSKNKDTIEFGISTVAESEHVKMVYSYFEVCDYV